MARSQPRIGWVGLAFLCFFVAQAQAEVPVPLWLRTIEWMDGPVMHAPTLGPDQLPESLPGVWRVSLCIKQGLRRGHSWIRYENVDTGEVHTIGKFRKGVPEIRHRVTRAVLYPEIETSGLYWDYDIRYEHEVRTGNYLVGSVVVTDPVIYRGEDVHGHGLIRDNCVTYTRDAWYHYSRQWYDLSLIHTPDSLLSRCHENDAVRNEWSADAHVAMARRQLLEQQAPASGSEQLPTPTTSVPYPSTAWPPDEVDSFAP